ncbi:transmembrane protein 6/97 [Myxozyma melibiosi]|uniref:Efficient mitochondria targeting-associated protein 19 n=1 Tax=Myxozyma melibiosi TaxID=54550 RepID=A0ABR1F7V9_9ASCO
MSLKGISKRPLDCFYFIYFIIHAFVTAFIDIGIIIPRDYRLKIQSNLLDLHVSMNNDPLLKNPPAWFVSFVVIEGIFQLPFFVVGAIAFYRDSKKVYIPTLVYGVNASLTTLACLIEITYGFRNLSPEELSDGDRVGLFWVYFPTFVIPLFMIVDMMRRLWVLVPSGVVDDKKTR